MAASYSDLVPRSLPGGYRAYQGFTGLKDIKGIDRAYRARYYCCTPSCQAPRTPSSTPATRGGSLHHFQTSRLQIIMIPPATGVAEYHQCVLCTPGSFYSTEYMFRSPVRAEFYFFFHAPGPGGWDIQHH
jgi:hypothetical protein